MSALKCPSPVVPCFMAMHLSQSCPAAGIKIWGTDVSVASSFLYNWLECSMVSIMAMHLSQSCPAAGINHPAGRSRYATTSIPEFWTGQAVFVYCRSTALCGATAFLTCALLNCYLCSARQRCTACRWGAARCACHQHQASLAWPLQTECKQPGIRAVTGPPAHGHRCRVLHLAVAVDCGFDLLLPRAAALSGVSNGCVHQEAGSGGHHGSFDACLLVPPVLAIIHCSRHPPGLGNLLPLHAVCGCVVCACQLVLTGGAHAAAIQVALLYTHRSHTRF